MRKRLSQGILLTALLCCVGCSDYTKVSPQAYQYTKALYSVCNRKDEPRLQIVAQQVEAARAEAQITTDEAEWINDIIADARDGDWQVASHDARQLMEAQIEGR